MNDPQLRYKESLLLMRNMGSGRFADVSVGSGEVLHQRWAGRGLAVGDLDNDGWEDFVVTTDEGPAYVIRNTTPGVNHWLTLRLVGHKSNRDAVGAIIRMTAGGSGAPAEAPSAHGH